MSRKNEVWAWDLIFDRTAGGTSLKWLSIIDEHTRECLCLKVARRMTSQDIEVSRGLFIAIATTFGYLQSLEGINNVEHGRVMALVSFSAASAFLTAGLSRLRTRTVWITCIATLLLAVASGATAAAIPWGHGFVKSPSAVPASIHIEFESERANVQSRRT